MCGTRWGFMKACLVHHAWWMHGWCEGAPIKHVWDALPHEISYVGVVIECMQEYGMMRGGCACTTLTHVLGGSTVWGAQELHTPMYYVTNISGQTMPRDTQDTTNTIFTK